MEVTLEPIIESIKLINIPDSTYFSRPYKDYISNSRMKLINPEEEGNPEKYKLGFGGSPIFSDSLNLGSAVHENILQPEFFRVQACSRPTAKLGFVIDTIIELRKQGMPIWKCILEASSIVNYYKDKLTPRIIANVISKGLPYYLERLHYTSEDQREPRFLGEKDTNRFLGCVDSLTRNREIQELLHPCCLVTPALSLNEWTIFMDLKATVDGKVTILRLKAKLDNFTYNYETGELVLNDLKTTGHYLSQFKGSWHNFHYFRQASYYMFLLNMVAKHILKVSPKCMKINFLVVSTIGKYESGVFRTPTSEVQRGWDEFKKLLKLIAICQVYGYDSNEARECNKSA